MSGRGADTLASVLAECLRRPGLLARELAWRWLYGIPALAVAAGVCFHLYRITSGTLAAAGVDQISLDHPWQSAAILTVAFQVVRPLVVHAALWSLPLLGLAWAIAAGIGRNLVFRSCQPDLPWRLRALIGIQTARVFALAVVAALWWGSVRWSAEASTLAGVPNLSVYFGLVAAFSLGFLVLWSLASWVFLVAPMFVLLEGKSLAASLSQSMRPSLARGELVGVNVAIASIRFALAAGFTVLSLLPLGVLSSTRQAPIYLWLAAVTVVYLILSSFLQVVRLVAFVRFWKPRAPRQNQVSPA
jgi:hypothetical protein